MWCCSSCAAETVPGNKERLSKRTRLPYLAPEYFTHIYNPEDDDFTGEEMRVQIIGLFTPNVTEQPGETVTIFDKIQNCIFVDLYNNYKTNQIDHGKTIQTYGNLNTVFCGQSLLDRDICVRLNSGSETAVSNISAELEGGKLYAVLGSSGSGKTTLLSLLGGLDTPTKGEVLFNGENTPMPAQSLHAAVDRRTISVHSAIFHLV